jgi:hypothetical protein
MTFLQPLILWGLPLVLLPVIIHLINRMRHRPRQWAAMQFLLAATRSSTSHARLRNLLIMLMRILAVLALLIFLARPLVGGWMGWALTAAPDTILLLLDRSASMDSRVAGADESRREYALRMLADAAGEFEHASHLVLLDSATRQASELPSAASLLEWPDTKPTDTAADLPAMLQTALDWLIENKAGTAEIWIASDLQASNWQPDDPRWETLITAFDSLPQKVRVRLLATTQESPVNASISIAQLSRQQASGKGEVRLAVDLNRSQANAGTATITRTLNDVATELEARVTGQSTRWRHRARQHHLLPVQRRPPAGRLDRHRECAWPVVAVSDIGRRPSGTHPGQALRAGRRDPGRSARRHARRLAGASSGGRNGQRAAALRRRGRPRCFLPAGPAIDGPFCRLGLG